MKNVKVMRVKIGKRFMWQIRSTTTGEIIAWFNTREKAKAAMNRG